MSVNAFPPMLSIMHKNKALSRVAYASALDKTIFLCTQQLSAEIALCANPDIITDRLYPIAFRL